MDGQPTSPARVAESVATAAGAALLGAAFGSLIDPSVASACGSIGAVNGLVSGWRRVYSWRRRDGWVAVVLDSTWATLPVLGSLVAHAVATVRRGRYEASLSTRQNRHVYRGGMRLKSTYAFTLGNVISNAGDVDKPRRRRLITDHEDVHVWQARWFGPIYPVVYALWAAGGVAVGALVWARRRRTHRLGTVIESCAYYANPFEWWAYSRDGNWPPKGKASGVGWKQAAVRPLAAVRTEHED